MPLLTFRVRDLAGLEASIGVEADLAASVADFYVAPWGSDSWPGTLLQPFQHIQRAIDLSIPGDLIFVRDGVYSEELIFGTEDSGEAFWPIMLEAYPGEHPIIQPPTGLAGDHYCIRIKGDWLELRGFVLRNSYGTSSADIYIEGGANDIVIEGNEIRDAQDQGIFTDATSARVKIIRNLIHDNGKTPYIHQSHGIYTEGDDHLIAGNVIYNHPRGFGIQCYPKNNRTRIIQNTIAHNGKSGIVLGGSGGVYDVIVANNIFAFNSDYGISHDSSLPHRTLIAKNITWGNLTPIQSGWGSDNTFSENVNVDPKFVLDSLRDFHVLSDSPAIDAARADYIFSPDFDGVIRPVGAGYDIGAYER